MAPQTWPKKPIFINDAEEIAWTSLKKTLRPEDVLLHGIRLTDPVEGDVEVDLLVLMPDLGMAALEVKGGHLSYAHGQVLQTGGATSKAIDPAEQARKEVRSIVRFLERQPNWSRGSIRTTWLVATPHTPITNGLGPTLPAAAMIGSNNLEDSADRVYDRLLEPALEARKPRADWIEAALEHLLGTFDEPGEIHARAALRLRHVDELTKQQAALLHVIRMVPQFEVTGSAGTGKTWMAMEQARLWTAEGERVCFTSYTRGATEAVNKVFSEVPEELRPAFVGTFFQLGFQWGIHAAGSDDIDFWTGRGPEEMARYAEGLDPDRRFTAFVIDEAQDFSDSWWPALLAAGKVGAKVAVFRDDEQAVFTERRGRPDLALVPLNLDENLRNARQIVDTFRSLIKAEIVSKAGEGFPVRFVEVTDGEVIAAADDVVAELVDMQGWLPEHVALLATRNRHPVQIERDVDKATYWQGLWETDDIFYSTVAGFKGLERPAVVLALNGFHEGLDPRNVLYAGMSRARDLLVIVGSAEDIEKAQDAKLLKRLRASSAS